ncbi:MAG: polysaccharide biosynthesis C-terminal domain-containing protein, partial [Vicinamibacterales bacterium]
EALRLLPAALLAVAFPALCVAPDTRLLKRLSLALATIGIALAALLYTTAPSVLTVVYGTRFVEAAPALRILALALPMFFLNYSLTHQVIAWDGQRAYLVITMAALTTNLVLNTWLIPTGGMSGAATSTLLTELVVMAGCVVALRRTVRDPAFLPRATSRAAGSVA